MVPSSFHVMSRVKIAAPNSTPHSPFQKPADRRDVTNAGYHSSLPKHLHHPVICPKESFPLPRSLSFRTKRSGVRNLRVLVRRKSLIVGSGLRLRQIRHSGGGRNPETWSARIRWHCHSFVFFSLPLKTAPPASPQSPPYPCHRNCKTCRSKCPTLAETPSSRPAHSVRLHQDTSSSP